jgi:hypothetical protein
MKMYYEPGPKGGERGHPRMFENPEELWEAAVEYFKSVADNNLQSIEIGWYQGVASEQTVSKPRAMHIRGLALFLGVSEWTYRRWYDGHPHFRETMDRISDVIKTQKFEGAMVGLFVPSIASRDLGLAEQVEQRLKDETERKEELTREELIAKLKEKGLPLSILDLDREMEEEGEE